MNVAIARDRLQALVGTDLGTGPWTVLSEDRIKLFGEAVGLSGKEVPAMLLLSLIPGLVSAIELPVDQPHTAVNYGLDVFRPWNPAKVGDRIRARANLLGVEEGSTWLQIKRRVTIENEAGEPLLEAETLTRLFW